MRKLFALKLDMGSKRAGDTLRTYANNFTENKLQIFTAHLKINECLV